MKLLSLTTFVVYGLYAPHLIEVCVTQIPKNVQSMRDDNTKLKCQFEIVCCKSVYALRLSFISKPIKTTNWDYYRQVYYNRTTTQSSASSYSNVCNAVILFVRLIVLSHGKRKFIYFPHIFVQFGFG